MSADLHCHSQFSDGAMEIPQLLKLARQAGLDHLAITDHETFHGYDYAAELAAGYGLKIIKGIELSARDPANGRSVHVLCYLPRNTAEIEALCERTRRARMKAGFIMAQRLCALYPQLTLEEIRHLLVEEKWFAAIYSGIDAIHEAVSHHLSAYVTQLVERYEYTLEECEDEVDRYEAEVRSHLERMGFVW